jgi:hypothetical protein
MSSSVRSGIFVAPCVSAGLTDSFSSISSVGAIYSPPSDMSLLRSYDSIYDYQPPVKTGGYKYFAPTERGANAPISGTERAVATE